MQFRLSVLVRPFYYLSVWILYYLCGQSWFQNLRKGSRGDAALVEVFLNEIKYPITSRREIKRNSLMTDMINRLWGGRLNSLAPVIVEGQEFVEKAQAANKGVIFARFHQKMGKTSSPLSIWLNQQQFRPQVTVGEAHETRVGHMKVSQKIVFAQDLFEAYKILRKHGVIQIVPDGRYGSQGLNIEFLQRPMAFQAGFAELAISTDALVIPIRLQYNVNGTIVIRISQALQVPPSELTHDQKIAFFVERYVEEMAEFWKASTHMITAGQMRKQLGTPKKPRRKSL